ncbi:MAG: phosphodiesterase [Magnetospirillum sp. WYHS-4]
MAGMIVAQLSDFHFRSDGIPIKGKVDGAKALAAALDHIKTLTPGPDLVLVTGDLIDKSGRPDYGPVKEGLASLGVPVYAIPGNHDDREAMRTAFADLGYLPAEGEFLHYTVEGHSLRLIGLDTQVPGTYLGELCPARLAWLEDRLAEAPDRPTLLFMHHPPFRTGIHFMDRSPFRGAEPFDALLRRHPQVLRLLCGHLHRPVEARFGGTVASTAPAIAFQMSLDLRPGAESTFVLEPAACPVFLWRPDTGLVGHLSPIGDYGPRHPFTSGMTAGTQ